MELCLIYDYFILVIGSCGGAVITHSPPTSEVCSSNLIKTYVGKLAAGNWWSAVYSTEPSPTVHIGFLCS